MNKDKSMQLLQLTYVPLGAGGHKRSVAGVCSAGLSSHAGQGGGRLVQGRAKHQILLWQTLDIFRKYF